MHSLKSLRAATETLLEVQEDLRGSKPFLKYLKSLKMTEKDFKELLTKVQAKLEEYDALPKAKDFLEEASYYLLMGGDNFKMSMPEMNFFFTLGMNLKWEILKSIKEA
jgi:CRISPR-associated protein Csh1